MTVHEAPSSASAHPSPPPTTTSAREALHALLSSTLAGTPVSLTTVERGAPLAGITAFRGVRETSLWFFDGDRTGTGAGVLSRPGGRRSFGRSRIWRRVRRACACAVRQGDVLGGPDAA
jgi:hypothetical protein